MAHFAKLGIGNIVEQVVVVSNDVATSEQAGVEFLQNLYKDRAVWKQTSFNTFAGKHWTFIKDENDNDIKVESNDQSKAFRKNFAGIGFTYDQTRNAFLPPREFTSFILDEDTCQWQPPIAKPTLTEQELEDGKVYKWNNKIKQWELDE
tara:strand:+ start:68 stop:514 length:447 start_codon:yes stop_codon:yes gene_type:complete